MLHILYRASLPTSPLKLVSETFIMKNFALFIFNSLFSSFWTRTQYQMNAFSVLLEVTLLIVQFQQIYSLII